jgi:hypothetical protein
MTLHRWGSSVEPLKRTGHVRRRDEVIAKASYDLRVEAEEITARSFVKGEGRFIRKSVTGEISLLDSNTLPDDNPTAPSGSFTLVLEDGREVDFRVDRCVMKSNPTRQECNIQGSGNKL